MRLHPSDIEQIAQRVARLVVAIQPPAAGQFIDAAELARVLGIERDCLRARRRVRRESTDRSARPIALRSTTHEGRTEGPSDAAERPAS